METIEVRRLRYQVHELLNGLGLSQSENCRFYRNLALFFDISERKAHIAMLRESRLERLRALLFQLIMLSELTREEVCGILLSEEADRWKEVIIPTKSDIEIAPVVQGYNRTE